MHHAKPCFYLPYGGADGTRTHDRRVANRTTGKTLGICLSKVAATKRNQWFSRSFPFLTIAYTSRPVFFGHVLAIWKFALCRTFSKGMSRLSPFFSQCARETG